MAHVSPRADCFTSSVMVTEEPVWLASFTNRQADASDVSADRYRRIFVMSRPDGPAATATPTVSF